MHLGNAPLVGMLKQRNVLMATEICSIYTFWVNRKTNPYFKLFLYIRMRKYFNADKNYTLQL